MTDFENLSTARLLSILKRLRTITSRPWDWGYEDFPDVYDSQMEEMEEIKKILATREHYPRGKAGRKLRMKKKQNR